MSTAAPGTTLEGTAWEAAAGVTDPELPMLTLADLGVLRDVTVTRAGAVTVVLAPTYSGCPALEVMRGDVVRRLRAAGFDEVTVTVSLSPPWSSDWITKRGRERLRTSGISPPGPTPGSTGRGSAVPLSLAPTRRAVRCPRCGSDDVTLLSEFGSTACTAIYRCSGCLEPFDHVKEH